MEEKKESWIEKLIELLNEYYKIKNYAPIEFYDDDADGFDTNYMAFYKTTLIISKKFWFIKWLVENEKIEYTKLNKIHTRKWLNVLIEQNLYEDLLMLLSIQDNPIEFLISILK